MSAPVIWVILPIIIGAFLLLLRNERSVAMIGGALASLFALIALIVPIDQALLLGPISFKISAGIQFFGRSLKFDPADGPLLAILYSLAALWFFGAEAAGVARRLVPLGMMIIALLVASIAVEPFLYAALLIEIAVLLSIPLLSPPNQKPGRGTIRFLIYQTMAMPFILFSGWSLAGVEASPGDLTMTVQSATMLGLGFAFLLTVFPLYNWIPLLAEETSPYIISFMLWALPTVTTIFYMGFLDRYTWLRTSSQLSQAVQVSGMIMVVTGGVWAAFQRHLGRIMAYASIVETGFILLAFSLVPGKIVEVASLFLIPRGLALAIWGLALSTVQKDSKPLRFSAVQGYARIYPLAVGSIILANLSVTGFPLLAGFPPLLALWEGLANTSLTLSFWLLIGLLGLLISAIRTLAIFVMAPERTGWTWNENWAQVIMLGVGVIGLFILGVFPQAMQPFLSSLPRMFEHLGQ
jgi:formate hydrogenlyase subunit 3/multisubunit Na+/H+ antiporter MnhD subunit